MKYRLNHLQEPWAETTKAVLSARSEAGFDVERRRMRPPEWVEIKEMEAVPNEDVTYYLPQHDFKNLVSAYAEVAWELGWRPEGFTHSDTSQQRRHLEDMRALVAHTLKTELPE